jgi:hypothetical protein
MSFALLGFSQLNNVRHFVFERVGADRTRISYTVDADLRALRDFRITMQELPLMCRRLLDALPEGDGERALTLTETDMRQHAAAGKAAQEQAALRKRTSFQPRKPGTITTFEQRNAASAAASKA